MPAYSFKERFVEPIRDGTKGGTIRAPRRIGGRVSDGVRRYREVNAGGHAMPGETLSLYGRQRHPGGFLIVRHRCAEVQAIELCFDIDRVRFVERGCDRFIASQLLDLFARFDGFDSWAELAAFWRAEHGPDLDRFSGWHIRWQPLPDAIRGV